MKTYILIAFILVTVSVNAQFKDQDIMKESPSEGIFNKSSNTILGFINPENFSMHHSFGLSYSTFAGEGVSLATYTNSMMYKFSDNMNVQLDASFITSPYSSLGKDFQNSLQKIYISRAAFNYRPWEDLSISVQYRSYPNYLYSPYNRFGSYGNMFFGGFSGYSDYPFGF